MTISESLGFIESGNQWYVYHSSSITPDWKKKAFDDLNMQVYQPVTTIKTHDKKGREKVTTSPKVFNYIFVLANRRQVSALNATDQIHPIYAHRNEGEIQSASKRWLLIPHNQMHILMRAIENSEEIELITPEEHLLEKGDKVLVIDGPFKDVEGILITSQGANGGKVYVSLTNTEGITTAKIPEEYIKVIEFSRHNDHFYRKIEAFEKILNKIFATYSTSQFLDAEQRANLQFFVNRYDQLRNLTYVNHAKLTACRFAALKLLGRDTEADECLKKFNQDTQQSKSRRRSSHRSPSAQKYLDKWIDLVQNTLH